MRANDPNIAKVELIAEAIGELADNLVFVGGCAAGLLITDPAAPPVRVTYDVDLLVQVATLTEYHATEKQLSARGFKRDLAADAPICRWVFNALEVDLMPTDAKILGFTNRWYLHAIETATRLSLPSGKRIQLISATAFIATKFEAFNDRGKRDLLGSHDLEDILNVIEGRPTLVTEIAAESAALRQYLAEAFAALIRLPNFDDYLPGLLAQDALLDERVAIVRSRVSAIARMV
jgi:predicted nucleotidyltransferase